MLYTKTCAHWQYQISSFHAKDGASAKRWVFGIGRRSVRQLHLLIWGTIHEILPETLEVCGKGKLVLDR